MSRLEHPTGHIEGEALMHYTLTEDDVWGLFKDYYLGDTVVQLAQRIRGNKKIEELKTFLNAKNIHYQLLRQAQTTNSFFQKKETYYEILLLPEEAKKLDSLRWYQLSFGQAEALYQALPQSKKNTIKSSGSANNRFDLRTVLKAAKLLPYTLTIYAPIGGEKYTVKLNKNISHKIFNLLLDEYIHHNPQQYKQVSVHLEHIKVALLYDTAYFDDPTFFPLLASHVISEKEFNDTLLKLHLRHYIHTITPTSDGFTISFKTYMTCVVFQTLLEELWETTAQKANCIFKMIPKAHAFSQKYQDCKEPLLSRSIPSLFKPSLSSQSETNISASVNLPNTKIGKMPVF